MKSPFALGQVELNVQDLDVMKAFYTEVLKLDVLTKTASLVKLGKNGTPLITLHHQPDFQFPHPNEAGLYHFALLFASRTELSQTLKHILEMDSDFFTGSADHLVSEAFYFTDPEGNGIELYYDRDRSSWNWKNGKIQMATMYLDPQEYIQRYLVLDEKDTNAAVGHVHLKVGNIDQAKAFYVDILGFDVTAEMPSALFISLGGYHHHIGLNTWESFGATERSDSYGLKSFEFILAEEHEVTLLQEKLKEHDIPFETTDAGLSFFDPWKNRITVTA